MGTLEQRVKALEGEMSQIREEWGVVAQAPLIQARLLNALRETQLEHSKELQVLKGDVQVLKGDTREHSRVLDQHSADLIELKQGIQTIVQMLTTLIDRE
jgi:hypothetical protein